VVWARHILFVVLLLHEIFLHPKIFLVNRFSPSALLHSFTVWVGDAYLSYRVLA